MDGGGRLTERRWFGPVAGALAAAVLAGVYVGATDPFASSGNDAYDAGQATGFVLRSAVLGIFAGGLAQELALRRRAIYGLGLAVVLGLLLVPPIFERESSSDRAERRDRAFRAGFMDGCTKNAPAPFCECVYEDLNSRGYTSQEEFDELQASGRYEGIAREAAGRCTGATE